MKLEQLRPNLCELPTDQAYNFFLSYVQKRAIDLKEVLVTPRKVKTESSKAEIKRKVKKKTEEVALSPEQLTVLKKLGLL